MARLVCILAFTAVAGCENILMVTTLAVTEPFRRANLRSANPHQSVSGQVVNEDGHPLEGAEAQGSTSAAYEGACFSVRRDPKTVKVDIDGSNFAADTHGSHLSVTLGRRGYHDYKVRVGGRRGAFGPSEEPEAEADQEFEESRVKDIRIVLRRHVPSRLTRYEGELECRPGSILVGATCDVETARFTFGKEIDPSRGGGLALRVPPGASATRPSDIDQASLSFPGLIAFVEPPAGNILDGMTWAPMMPDRAIEYLLGDYRWNSLPHSRQLDNGDRVFAFYFRTLCRYGKGQLTVHPPGPAGMKASIVLMVQEDGSRNLDVPGNASLPSGARIRVAPTGRANRWNNAFIVMRRESRQNFLDG